VATLVRSVDRPVNVVAGMQGIRFTLAELAAVGVKRVSIGGALSRVALAGAIRAAREMRDHGTFTFVDEPITSREISKMLGA
jgi:2-methylisocitrate lyase-like PEP mutase family enzyme